MNILYVCAIIPTFVGVFVDGRVLELDERFREARKSGEWIVMFYAPWCGHCKQLEPIWMNVGEAMEGLIPVHVARLDCTRFSSLSSEFGVRGFPTIKYISGENEYEYRGPRTKEDIIDFAKKARGEKVTFLSSLSEISALRKSGKVFYMYYGEDTDNLRKTYDKVAGKFFLSMPFYAAAPGSFPSVIETPTVLVFKDGTYFEMPLSAGTVDSFQLSKWISSEQISDYSELTGSSFLTLKNTGKHFAVAVLPTGSDRDLNDLFKSIALSRNAVFHSKFAFCWVEGSAIVDKMTYSTIQVPNFVVFNPHNYEYYVLNETSSISKSITEVEVRSFLTDVVDGKLTALGGSGYAQQFNRFIADSIGSLIGFFKATPIIASLVIGLPTFIVTFLCYCLCTMEDVEMETDEGTDSEYDDHEDMERPPQYEDDNQQLRRRFVDDKDESPEVDVPPEATKEETSKDK